MIFHRPKLGSENLYSQREYLIMTSYKYSRKENVRVKSNCLCVVLKELARQWTLDNSLIPDEYLSWLKTQDGFSLNSIKSIHIKKLIRHFDLTWHEVEDGFTGLLVPRSIHSVKFGGVPHLGGVSVTQKYSIMQDVMNAIRTTKCLTTLHKSLFRMGSRQSRSGFTGEDCDGSPCLPYDHAFCI